MDDPLRELEHLRKLAAAEPTKRFDRLSRLVGPLKLLTGAGERVRQNTGGRTAGIDGQTRSDIDPNMLLRLADELAQTVTNHKQSAGCTSPRARPVDAL